MVIADDATNNYDDFTLTTVSIWSIIEYSPEYTNILKSTQTGMIIGYPVTNMYPDSCSME
jgi:hypothetical protein